MKPGGLGLAITALIAITGASPGLTAGQSRGGTPVGSVPSAQTCAALPRAAGLPNASTVISSAVLNPASAAAPSPAPQAPVTPALPEHCEIVGKLNERIGVNGQRYAINFRLRLPTAWNGRFFFQGGGGSNGTVGNALGALQGQQPGVALALGYAVVSQDSGHDNGTNNDPARGGTTTFGLDPQARLDFGYNSYDQVTQVSKALIRVFYGRAVEKSYFVGCSEGGREGMMLSQRFPAHFDGILACAPGFRLPRAAIAESADSQAFAGAARAANLVDANNQPFLNKSFTDEDLALVARAALDACDSLDGLADGMIQDFTGCTTAAVSPRLEPITCRGPKTPACLSSAQIVALKTVFDGTRTSTGVMVYPRWAWDIGVGGQAGAGFNQGWRSWKLGAYGAPANSAINLTLGASALPHIFVTPPIATAATGGAPAAFSLGLTVDAAFRALANTTDTYRESSWEFMKADSTDLAAFKARGGRLIIAQGVSDPVFSIIDTVDWWKDLDAVNAGRASEFVRLFAVPGMNHCAGGPATDQFDAFGALVNWVEHGSAPDRIVATARMTTPWPGRTRPLCAYPMQARYTGSGSVEDAGNFVCR
jgi:pimeloyl-ACP methyl ester carboxylesterase